MKNIGNKNHKTKTKTKKKDNNKVAACFGYKQFPSFNSFRL